MDKRNLWVVAGGLMLLTGCDVFQSARNDFNRFTSSNSTASHPPATSVASRAPASASTRSKAPPSPATSAAPDGKSDPKTDPAKTDTAKEGGAPPPLEIVGKNEGQLRTMLGPPTNVEEHAPGKTWRYRDGQCTYNVQLYPDVQTRQFGTLAYEVKSDDNTDEGNRACLAQLRSRAQSGG